MGLPARDWLDLLVEGLERVGVTVLAGRSSCGELRLTLAAEAGDVPLEVTASREPGAPGFLSAAGLSVGYRGRAELGPAEARAVAVVGRLLEGLGPRIPRDLEAAAVRLPAGTPPHEELRYAFPFCTVERAAGPGGAPEVAEVLVRLTARCNQACPFCSAPPPLPDPSDAALGRLLERAAVAAPRATVTLTGGEPTLRPGLDGLVLSALDAVAAVEIQTNAVLLGDGRLADALEPGPRLRFFVSLHGMDDETYDRCTGTRRQLPRALAGVRALLAAGHRVVLSTVVCSLNLDHLDDWVEAVASELPGPPRPAVHFSITLCPEHRPEARELLVPYRALGAALVAAADRAEALGLEVEPLLSSTHAAIPACMVGRAHQRRAGPVPHVEARETGADDEGRPWVKAPRCRACPATGACPGVPRAYAERFGLDELDPSRVR